MAQSKQQNKDPDQAPDAKILPPVADGADSATPSIKAGRAGAIAAGSFAIGALAMGAVAIGALAIGRLAIGRMRLRDARIDHLSVGELEIDEIVSLSVRDD